MCVLVDIQEFTILLYNTSNNSCTLVVGIHVET